jgi:enoyl-CoA hydratase
VKARKEADEEGQPYRYMMSNVGRFFLEVIVETWKPTIAALNGAAVAGGFETALACDMRIAADHVVMGLPEAKRGMGAHFATIMLPRVIPRAIALELLFRGDYIDAAEAYRIGLVNRVVPKGQALDAALELAEAIARNAPITVRRMKETAVEASGLPLAAALGLNEGINPYLAEDRVEGIRAYAEKREPQWKGR